MDRRDIREESGFAKDLKNTGKDEYIDYTITENGKSYRIPYKMVREMVITGVDKQELKDIPHSARIQYRLLLLDSILKAKIEFIRGKVTITYNPTGAANSKDKEKSGVIVMVHAGAYISIRSNVSNRSINIKRAIELASENKPGIIESYGGHEYASSVKVRIKESKPEVIAALVNAVKSMDSAEAK